MVARDQRRFRGIEPTSDLSAYERFFATVTTIPTSPLPNSSAAAQG